MKMNATQQEIRSNGFTLVEVLIAMFLLVTALLGTAAVTTTVIKGNSFSNRMTQATTLAQDKMEELKGMSYASMTSGNDTPSAGFQRTWTVTPDSPAADMATIVVTVTFPWNGTRTVTLSTLRSQ